MKLLIKRIVNEKGLDIVGTIIDCFDKNNGKIDISSDEQFSLLEESEYIIGCLHEKEDKAVKFILHHVDKNEKAAIIQNKIDEVIIEEKDPPKDSSYLTKSCYVLITNEYICFVRINLFPQEDIFYFLSRVFCLNGVSFCNMPKKGIYEKIRKFGVQEIKFTSVLSPYYVNSINNENSNIASKLMKCFVDVFCEDKYKKEIKAQNGFVTALSIKGSMINKDDAGLENIMNETACGIVDGSKSFENSSYTVILKKNGGTVTDKDFLTEKSIQFRKKFSNYKEKEDHIFEKMTRFINTTIENLRDEQ